jgi:DNA replication and repair protein RecF
MPFDRIRISSFRNLEDAEIAVEAERVFLIGENGQGKTNFLEALYYLCYGSSFRGSPDGEAIRYGSDSFVLEGLIRKERSSSLPPEEIRLRCERGGKEIRRSGKKLADRKELVEINPAVVFCHEDFAFAAGEPERRRFFFDQTAGLVSTGYIDLLRDYKRALKQRNAALRDKRTGILELLDEQVAGIGLQLVAARSSLETELAALFSELYERVSLLGSPVALHYRPSWREEKDIESIMARLASKREEELGMGTSLSGPHRDRWTFSCEGRDFASYASTGQLRLLSLVLRSLQAGYYTAVTGSRPVLLLDDVLLELDPEKRRRFLASIPASSQAFFTFLPGEGWEDFRASSMIVYRVDHGRFAD